MFFFFFQAEDGIRDSSVTGVQTCALPILLRPFDTSRKRTSVRMQRVYTMPIEDVQQLSQGAIALITGGLGARCHVHLLALPPELLQRPQRLSRLGRRDHKRADLLPHRPPR